LKELLSTIPDEKQEVPVARNVIVMIGDIVASRKIKGRVAFDERLQAALDGLSAANAHSLSPYTLTIGDEIQAVFDGAGGLFHDAVALLAAIHPQVMRFSIGVGPLSKPINRERAIGMDGQAFYSARAGIERLKGSGYLFTVSGEGLPSLGLLQHTLALLSAHISKWNHTRLATLESLGRGLSVRQIAADLGVSDKAVYKSMAAGELELVRALFDEIEAQLDAGLQEER
jgi:hypothetical protein